VNCILKKNLIFTVQLVIMNLFAGNRDPTAFDQPDEFIPERWLDEHKGRTDLLGEGGDKLGVVHLTYGAGRCVCPGIDSKFRFPDLIPVLVN
jgi:cytochrome P450